MRSSNADIMARLTLNADQFASETGRRFAELKASADRIAPEVKRPLLAAFAEVQARAQTALQMPRSKGGGLDLRAEIASLTEAERKAEEHAAALRDLSVASLAASRSVTSGAEALRLEADAALAASIAEEKNADALRGKIVALKAVQSEMDRLHGVSDRVVDVTSRTTAATGASRAAMQGLSYQVQDAATQLSMGANAFQVIAIQGGQAAGAFAHVEGRAGNMARFLMGPWGLALTVATMALGPMVSKLFEGGDALDAEVDKLRKSALATAEADRAKRAFAATEEGAIAGVAALTAEIERQNAALSTNAQRTNQKARDEEANVLRQRDALLPELAEARRVAANLRRRAPGGGGDGGSGARAGAGAALGQAELDVANLEDRIRTLNGEIARAQAARLASQKMLAAEQADRVLDPNKAIEDRYQQRVKAAQDAATAEEVTNGALTRRLVLLGQIRDHDLKREADRRAAASRATGGGAGDAPTIRQLTGVVRDILPGVRITSTTGGRHVRGSHHYQGRAVDFVPAGGMGATSKADIRRQVEARGLVVDELLGPGDRGHSDHFHLSVKAGRAALENYRETVKLNNAAEREAKELLDQRAAAYGQLTASLDPATAALDRYLATMAQIGALSIGTDKAPALLSMDRMLGLKLQARGEFKAADDAWRDGQLARVMGQDQVDRYVNALGDGLERDAVPRFERKMIEASASAADHMGFALGSAADLFGVRMRGPAQMLMQPGRIKDMGDKTAQSIREGLKGVGIELGDRAGDRISAALQGAAIGQIGGGIFTSITGGKSSALASGLGGVLGEVAGKEIGSAVGKGAAGLVKSIAGAGGPIGAVVGGVLGSVMGSLFKGPASRGSAGVTMQGGTFAAGAATGTNANATSGAATLAGSVSAGLNRIAELLGAQVTGSPTLSIGTYKGELRVNPNGGAVGGVKGSGALSFANEQAAVAYAISDALKDGVLSGISDASLAIIRSGQDLERAIGKAMLIEDLPKQLRAQLDPVGAALDEVNGRFQKLRDALVEGGASAEQMAQAQQLYRLEIDRARASTPAAAQTLRDFLSELRGGSNSPLSLRDQQAEALGKLNPYLAAIEGGQAVDQQKYAAAAQSFLDISRQMNGSSRIFFQDLDRVQAATSKAIAQVENAAPIGTPTRSPFEEATAANTAKAAEAARIANEMAESTNDLLAEQNDLLRRLVAGGATPELAFIGTARGFA